MEFVNQSSGAHPKGGKGMKITLYPMKMQYGNQFGFSKRV